MEEKLIVFISSRINHEMKRARRAVREAIEELPLTRPWLFEEAPATADLLDESYLRWVGKCDLFILLLGEDITEPVRVEWEAATQARKPRLVFLKKGAQDDAAWAFAKGLDLKWKEYRTLAELKREVQAAVGDELIKGFRAYGVNEAERAGLQEHVQGLRTGDITIGGDVVFQIFAQAPVPLSRHIRLREFQTLVVERTKRFIGRDFVFKAIDGLLEDSSFPSGYIVISGEPGIGKTALIAELVNRKGYVHHFNIAAQNIRSSRDFLANVCAQLIVRHDLEHFVLPPEATQDSGFLSQLLAEATAKQGTQKVVILIDALDEAEDIGLAPGANILYLPPILPDGVYFVVATRERADFRLFVDQRKDIYLRDDDPQNLEDVRQYIRDFVEECRDEMVPKIGQWGVEEDEFVEVITEKSEGNFMYLVYVLGDIRDGKLTAENVDNVRNLPKGLQAYYQRHWRSMRAQDEERFDKYQEPVVCILATVREPVTVAQVEEWTQLRPTRIKQVIDEWREFLNVDESGDELLYSIYHTSFQDFLKEGVGLVKYEDGIAVTALRKIPGFLNGGTEG